MEWIFGVFERFFTLSYFGYFMSNCLQWCLWGPISSVLS